MKPRMAETCEPHDDGWVCIRSGPHIDCTDNNGHFWDNLAAIYAIKRGPKRASIHGNTNQQILDAARRTKPELRAGPIMWDYDSGSSLLVRHDDPANAHQAIENYEPRRNTAKARVLACLRSRRGEWIDAVEFTAPEIGGFAGTRRLRELREAGCPIETRPSPGQPNVWQHRLMAE